MPSFSPLVKSLFDNPYLPRRVLASHPTRQYAYISTSNHIGGLNMLRRATIASATLVPSSAPNPVQASSPSTAPKTNGFAKPSTHPARTSAAKKLYHANLPSTLQTRRAPSPTNIGLYPSNGIFKKRDAPSKRHKGHAEQKLWKHRAHLVATIIAEWNWSIGRKVAKIEQLGKLSWEGEVLEAPPPPRENKEFEGKMEGRVSRGSGLRKEVVFGEGDGDGEEMSSEEMGEDELREYERMMEEELCEEADRREKGKEKMGWIMTPQCVMVVDGVWRMAKGM